MAIPVWTSNLSCLPEITVDYVKKWANKDCMIPRAVLLKGYSNWIEGYVHNVEAPNTAPYGSTGNAEAVLACRYLILALSSFISVY